MEKTLEDIGIYTDIHESGNTVADGHKLYYATCKMCGIVVEKRLADIKGSNKVCRHKVSKKDIDGYKVNDMPKGWMNWSELNMKIYYLWKAMISRTTKKYWEKYPTYTGTTVDDKWRMLSNFVNDIKELEGYEDWATSSNHQMMLDKDTIVEGNKHYSKDTCRFITHTESNKDVWERHPGNIQKAQNAFKEKASEPVKFVSTKTDKTIIFPSLKEACRILNLNLRNAWMVLSEKYPNHHTIKGWEIYKV